MKKLTAGIFTVLMGLVTVNAAEAAVASKGYVDEKVGGATTSIEALTQTVAANKTAAEKLVSDYKTENDAKVNANTTAIAKNAEDILANTGLISDNADAIAANTEAITGEKNARIAADSDLDTRLKEVEKFSGEGEGSVAKQISDALTEAKGYTDTEVKELADGAVATNTANISAMDTAYKAADTTLQGKIDAINNAENGILKQAKDYTDDLAEGAVADNAAAIAAINNADTGILKQAQTYADAEVKELADGTVADNTAAIAAINNPDSGILKQAQTYADGLDAVQKTAFENADKAINDKIGTVADGKTVVEMIADAQTAATYNDTEVRGLISAETTARTEADTAINTKIGTIADGKTVSGLISDNATEIAKKLTDTTTISEDGKYVLTAVTVGDDTTYAWELITRETGTEQE